MDQLLSQKRLLREFATLLDIEKFPIIMSAATYLERGVLTASSLQKQAGCLKHSVVTLVAQSGETVVTRGLLWY